MTEVHECKSCGESFPEYEYEDSIEVDICRACNDGAEKLAQAQETQ